MSTTKMDDMSISDLSAIIARNTKIIDDYLWQNGASTQSDSLPNIPDSAPDDVQAATDETILATERLNRLLKGPAEPFARGLISSLADMVEVQFVQRFGIAHLVPSNGSISYQDLATKTGLDADDIERVLKRATLRDLFRETEDGCIAHTATSRMLVDNPSIASLADFFAEEAWPSFSQVVEAMDRSRGGDASAAAIAAELSGFSVFNNTTQSMYAYLETKPHRMARFAKAMESFAAEEDFSHVLEAIDWTQITTVVDVGGAFGPVSIELAKAFPNLRCVVQDFDNVVKQGAAQLPPSLKDRVTFESHDMFEQQPRVGADVYLFCSIFHNWSDAKCIEILRAHIPALRSGTHIVILDWGVATAETKSPLEEKQRRTMDLTMMAFFRGKERSSQDWMHLAAKASPNFKVASYKSPSPIVHLIWEA